MSKVQNNTSTEQKNNIVSGNPSHSLDTLEVTSDWFKSKSHESLYRSTLRKGTTLEKLIQLIDVATPSRKKKYWKTYHCKNVLLQDGNRFIGSLCRKRWCQTCNRIKTAELMNAYKKPLLDFKEPCLVTLTAPTVKARQLNSEITKRIKSFQRAKDNLRKNHGIKLNGVRKTEVTYNEKEDKYHPHFHFIIDGMQEAEKLRSLWLDQFPNANLKAQDIKLIEDEKGLIEVFKYATKDIISNKTTARAQNIIYTAIEGKRIYQTFGSVHKVNEPKEEKAEQIEADFISQKKEIYIYDSNQFDYINSNDELLIDTLHIKHQLEIEDLIKQSDNSQKNKEKTRT
jgi:plasmid rolling circle replication initiator protein Rep